MDESGGKAGFFGPCTIEDDVTIAAPAAAVWDVLTGFATYPGWNPHLGRVEGRPEVGQALRVTVRRPKGVWRFAPVVRAAAAPHDLAWAGTRWLRGMLDVASTFHITPLGDAACRLDQSHRFSGWMVPVFRRLWADDTTSAVWQMGQAIKQRAERAPAPT